MRAAAEVLVPVMCDEAEGCIAAVVEEAFATDWAGAEGCIAAVVEAGLAAKVQKPAATVLRAGAGLCVGPIL